MKTLLDEEHGMVQMCRGKEMWFVFKETEFITSAEFTDQAVQKTPEKQDTSEVWKASD